MNLDYHLIVDTVKHGNLKLLRELLKIPSVVKRVDANDNYALRWATANGHLEIVKLLLSYPKVAKWVSGDDNYALWTAAKDDHTEIVRLLREVKRDE